MSQGTILATIIKHVKNTVSKPTKISPIMWASTPALVARDCLCKGRLVCVIISYLLCSLVSYQKGRTPKCNRATIGEKEMMCDVNSPKNISRGREQRLLRRAPVLDCFGSNAGVMRCFGYAAKRASHHKCRPPIVPKSHHVRNSVDSLIASEQWRSAHDTL